MNTSGNDSRTGLRVCLYHPWPGKTWAPLNLAYIAAYLQSAFPGRHEIRIIDAAFSKDPIREIVDFAPDVVGFTTLSATINKVYGDCRQVKAALPHAMLVCGGVHATIRAEEVLDNGFDVAVIGEGERTFADLVHARDALGRRLSWEDCMRIAGTACRRDDGQVMRAPPRDLIMDLDSLPHPARDLLDWHGYASRFSIVRGQNSDHVFTLHGSRGCPFRCIFCGVNHSFQGTVRRHSPRYIVDEMTELVDRFGARFIFFTDDIFLVDKKHMETLCRAIIERGIHKRVKWEVQIRSNLIREKDQDLLHLMREAGCRQVDIGFESANQRVLTLIKGPGITVEDHQRAIDMLNVADIGVLGTFIIATPTETYNEMMDTVHFIQRNYRKLSSFHASTMTPYPGSPVYEMIVKDGIIADDYVHLLEEDSRVGVRSCGIICSRNVTRQQVEEVERLICSLSIGKISTWDKIRWLRHNIWHNPDVVMDGIRVGLYSLLRNRRFLPV